MHLHIGDKVAVLDDVLKGYVVDIEEYKICIEDASGMQYHFAASELVKIEAEQYEMSKYSDINHPLLQEKTQTQYVKKKSFFVRDKKEVILEIDLHINQLVQSTRGMDNYDMLSLQVATAKSKLEYAIQKRISKIVFIHGKGAGVLKTELEFLFGNYPVRYYDASYQKYGLGATEVYIYQNKNSL